MDLPIRLRRALAVLAIATFTAMPPARAQEAPGDAAADGPADQVDEPTPGPVDGADDGGDATDREPAEGDSDDAPPPRCAPSEVDLTPDDAAASCIAQSQLRGLLDGFEAVAGEEAQALGELSDVLNSLSEREAGLDVLTLRLADVRSRHSAALADSRFAELRTAAAREGLDDIEEVLDTELDLLREQAIDTYVGGESESASALGRTLSVENLNDLATLRQYASLVVAGQQAAVDEVEALRTAAARMEEVVADIEARAEVDAATVDRVEAEVTTLLAAQEDLVAESQGEAAALAEHIAEIQARKATFAEALNISGAGGGAVGALLQDVQVGQVPPTSLGFLVPPVAPVHISSGFGPRVHPIFADTRLHTGLDMSAAAGDAVHAAADGVVVMAEEVSGYGNLVVIEHGNTVATLYAHLTADAVAVGDIVEVGDLVGFAGSTGWSTGPHLHFEVRVLGQPVDPLPYLLSEDDDASGDPPS